MRKLLTVVLALLLSAGIAGAAAISDTAVVQNQFDGGVAGVIPGIAAGGIGGAGAGDAAYGFSIATTPGDSASSISTYSQTQGNTFQAVDGAGTTFFQGTTQTVQNGQVVTTAGGGGNPGISGAGQLQGGVVGSAGVTAGGVFGVAGSAGAAGGLGAAGALGDATAAASQNQTFAYGYLQQSVNPNGGFITQQGQAQINTVTNATAAQGAGLAFTSAGAAQAGGSLVQQNGVGTAQQGRVSGAGIAYTGTAAIGSGAADASANAVQTHSYNAFNVSADGTSQQTASGSVTTSAVSTSP